MLNTLSIPQSPPGQVGGSDRYTDDDFWRETPDEASAHAWFASVYWPDGVRCPECCCRDADVIKWGVIPVHRCYRCGGEFSITTDTLMDGMDLTLLEWRHALYVFTGGAALSAIPEMAQRTGWDDAVARAAMHRLLQAAAEPAVPLREPAELDWTEVAEPDDPGDFSEPGKSLVIGLVGRRSRRVAGLRHIPDAHKFHIERFVRQHLVEGMMLLTDSHLSNLNLDWKNRHSVAHARNQYASGAACTNRTEGMWTRVKRVLDIDHSWYWDRSLTHWLDGLRWRENHRILRQPERMMELAQGMRWRRPRRIRDEFSPRQGKLLHWRMLGNARVGGRNATALAVPGYGSGFRRLPRADGYGSRRVR